MQSCMGLLPQCFTTQKSCAKAGRLKKICREYGYGDQRIDAAHPISLVVQNTLRLPHGKSMRKILPLYSIVLLCAFGGQAFAGANTAQLNCTGSHAGHALTLVGDVPASIVEVDLKLSYRGQTLRLASPEAETSESTDFRHGIFRLKAALSGSNRLQLQAKPKSIKYTGSMGRGKLNASFRAILKDAPEPFKAALKGAELSCIYAYEV